MSDKPQTGPKLTRFEITAIFAGLALVIIILTYFILGPAVGVNGYITWLVAWSIATFALYGLDKFLAIRHWLRVPEMVLHILALCGGAIGGWLGMVVFRHKIRHTIFYVVLSVGTVLQLAIGYYLFFGAGR
jgi:uncharacterized membrane protein YsdA (DUF1294 family)